MPGLAKGSLGLAASRKTSITGWPAAQIDAPVYELYGLPQEEIRNPPAGSEPAGGSVEATNGRINALVYELYGLTEEEIGVVEGLDHE